MKDAPNQKATAALLSVTSNIILVILKLAVGVMMGSVSVTSEAIHSSVDLLAALIAYLAVKTSDKPADLNHPFGYGKVENISGTVEALLIFLAAGWIILEAVRRLQKPVLLEAAGWGVGVMLVASAANILVSQKLFAVGKETESMALQADAWHHRTDVYTSAGVMAGLIIIWIGGVVIPGAGLAWVDPVVAIGVALMIIKAAYDLTLESTSDLLDMSLPADEEAHIRRCIASFAPAVRGFHMLKTRKSGQNRFAEFHILVDAGISVDESHRITEMILATINEHYPGITVVTHTDPCNGTCSPECKEDCLLSDDDRRAIRFKR